jgi:hypothetical protein
MKLRLQLASLVPATAKVGPADVHEKSAFGTTMREIMATLPSGESSPAGISQAFSVMQAQLKKNQGNANTAEASAVSADEGGQTYVAPKTAQAGRPGGVPPYDNAVEQSELLDGQSKPLQGPTVTEPPAAQMAQGTDEKPAEEISLLPQPPQTIADRGEQPRQSPAGTEPHLSPISKDESSRARHKAGGEEGAGTHPAVDGPSYDVLLIAPPISVPVPVAAPEPAGSKPIPLTASPQVDRGHMRAQVALGGVPVQPVIASDGELRAGPLTTPVSPAQAQARITVPATSNKVFEPASSDTSTEHSPHAHLIPATDEKAIVGAGVPPNQNHHLQAAAAAEFVANTKPIDGGAQKQSEGKSGTEQEPESIGNLSHHSAATSFSTQHQAESNVPPPIFHGTQRVIEDHRPQATAAQVLQRMDMAAPSGAVQLRADARRLDVGVSSGALGWVEVRATTAASGRVDATLHVQNDSSAYALASQSREITNYAREHSVPLGELSVGVGTGDSAREDSRNSHNDGRNGNGGPAREMMRPPTQDEHTYSPADTVSFISIRA